MSSSYSLAFWQETQDALAVWQGLNLLDKRDRFFYATAPGFRPGKDARFTPELLRVIGLTRRARSWTDGDKPDFALALKSLTTHEERHFFASTRLAKAEVVIEEIRMKIESGTWVSEFLNAAYPSGLPTLMREWMARLEMDYGEAEHKALQAMLVLIREKGDASSEGGHSLAAEELLAWATSQEKPNWPLWIFWAVRLVLLLPYVDPKLGLRFYCPSPVKQAAVEVQCTPIDPAEHTAWHATPFLIDDIDALLHGLKLEPVTLLSDGFNAPMAYLRKVGKRFKPLGFVGPAGCVPEEHGFLPEMRAGLAWQFIAVKKMFEPKGRSWKKQLAEITPAGLRWLAMDKEEKWKCLLHELPFGRAKPRKFNAIFESLGGFSYMPLPYQAVTGFVWKSMEDAILKIGSGVFYNPWLLSLLGSANPFALEASRDPELAYAWKRWEEPVAAGFKKLLLHYLAALTSIGAIAFAHTREGRVGIQLTAIGQYVFGLSEVLDLATDWPKVALVGPDFTITLMEPAPMVAEALREFSDSATTVETRLTAGAAFKMSRASIQRAAAKGKTFESVQTFLQAVAKNELPPQVMRQVQEWFHKRSLIRSREGLLIEGDDPLAMAELRSRFPKEFEVLSPTALLYTGKAKRPALMEKLAKAGFHHG